jgi:hypothetical protein
MYAIKESTLTALGDAVRNKTGKLTREEEVPVTVKYDVSLLNIDGNYSEFSKRFDADNMTAMKLKIVDYKGPACDIEEVEFNYNRTNIQGDPNYGNIKFTFDENNEAFIDNLPNPFVIFYFRIFPYTGVNVSCGFTLEVTPYDADGNILVQTETVTVTNTMTPLQMAEEINNIPPGPTAEELVVTGNCNYRFAYSGWDWVIKKYGNMITTKDISGSENMFYNSKMENIPFDLNFNPNSSSYHYLKGIFYGCKNLIEIPKINGAKPYSAEQMFQDCNKLRELDYESIKDIDWSYIDRQTSAYLGSRANTFYSCYSLRSFPMEFLNHGNPVVTYSYSVFYYMFYGCYTLDEVINLPNPHSQVNWTSNAFTYAFDDCYRLKNLTFALQDDGTPYVCSKWKNQTIDLAKYVGYTQDIYRVRITDFNSGITADKEVKDDATYQALKNDPDWFTTDRNYCRYNHDSAVATINSLPDCSALGGNTIKFLGAAGALTDGGAINTLTEEEIAVAAAKGWTVSFV